MGKLKDFQVRGYEQLELSTQVIIASALKRKVKVEVLDPVDQFLRLRKGKQVEYIRQATKTSRDSYIGAEILGNKVVTKQLLREARLTVPSGEHYFEKKSAQGDFSRYQHSAIVVKPKNTNYGIGITVFRQKFSRIDYARAVDYAFQFDRTILVEQFIEGKECRFLVIGSRCVAVLHRMPANVLGDGKRTIEELVRLKNKDPRRGQGHTTPLEKIEIGEVELQVLSEQKLTPQSIPKNGLQIFLRHNSNISTGGDSIDYTDIVHPGYRQIAEKATKTIGAKICGVDIIAPDFTRPATSKNYAILELNYNPVLYFHNFPYLGTNRDVGKHVLDLLGF